ncbi:hypothetical protein HDC92_004651 [Pedobacter sp. AK017]|uniref:hypothetical protein n=1 Tax=Pedobacter sp. AK017 TaxID=2723073 RepID=UPI001610D2C7|nr:hypothetical protein [Pedobacter sp. AK017]MBB5440947.1 hypothetical protein [Pedobacter sp. AK017]
MKRRTKFCAAAPMLLIMLLMGMVMSCKDFIEPSLEKRKVVLLAPADGAESGKYQVGFWWEPVEDALYYRLQLVTPDFAGASSMVADTLMNGLNKISLTLDPGRYQWRVRAENGSSHTAYTSAGFIIHESSVEEQKVILSLPGSGYLSNQETVQLKWNALFGAEQYRLQIDTENFGDEAKMVYNGTSAGLSYSFTFPKEGLFKWRVRAENATVQSKWSDIFNLSYDISPPGKVTIVGPANGLVVTKPVTLQWTAVATAKKYKLYVFKNDKTVYSSGFPALVSGTSYVFNLGEPGEKVYWRVSAVDEAGNEGALSDEMNFSIQ